MKVKNLKRVAMVILLSWYGQNVIAQTPGFVQEEAIKVANITTPEQVLSLNANQKQVSRTFIDGQGRPIQTVAMQASPTGKDIIQAVKYDNLGRQTISYLPYVGSNGTGFYHPNALPTEQAAFYLNGTTDKVADDSSAFSQQIFENSPLQRVLKAGNIGKNFQPVAGQHFKTMTYRNNTTSDNVIIYNNLGASGGNYPANALSVTEGLDEDNGQVVLFKDKNGRLILKRQVLSPGQKNDTYYIYNNAGNISYIIPPKAVVLMAVNGYTISNATIQKLMFTFVYDEKGRLINKRVPGAESLSIVYDPLDRPVLIQDGNLRALNKWNYIKYDAEGHAISQGIYTDATRTTRAAMQTYVDGFSSAYNSTWYESRNTVNTNNYYTNAVFPTTNIEPLAYSYYDDYDRNLDGTQDYTYQTQSLTDEATPTLMTRGMVTMVLKRTIGQGLSNIWLSTVMFYDKRGLLIQTQSNNQLNYTQFAVTDNTTTVYDFTGKPMLNKVKQVTTGGTANTILTTFNYSSTNNNYLAGIDQKYNAQAMVTIAAYGYNELGQLVKKNLHSLNSGSAGGDDVVLGASDSVSSGQTKSVIANNSIVIQPGFIAASGSDFSAKITSYLQSVDYRYNIRGQLTGINDSKLSTPDDDLFGMTLLYDAVDPNMGNTPSYSGRISAVSWMSRDGSNSKTSERAYKYSYDALNRLTDAIYAERTVAGTGSFNQNVNGFNEHGLTYDENGNILTLKRRTSTVGGTTSKEVDNLIYTYDTNNPNQLKTVTDGVGADYTGFGFRNLTGSTVPYRYDANGNLTADHYKADTIAYNYLNKTDRITITSASGRYIAYTYGADGTVLRKRVYDNSLLVSTTDYINGFVYENTALNYFSMPEGRVVSSGGTLQPEYVITDHQGNARFSFKDNGSGGMQILQENSYYAFGKTMPNSTVGLPTNPNNKLYNGGSEWQNTFSDLPDYYQTYYRNYDPAIGRFIGVDPMAETSDELTTYHYTGNNPVMFNDPLGDQKYTPDERITEVGLSFFKHGWFGYGQERWDALGVRSAEMMEQLQDLQYEPRVNADGSVTIYDSGDPNLSGPGAAAAANGLIQVWNPFGGNQISKQQWLDKGGNPDLIKAGQSPSYYGGAWKTVGNITIGGAGQGGPGDPPTHAQELAKYGQIISAYNLSFGASTGPIGATVETGIIFTDKNWARAYKTIYYSPGFASPSAALGFSVVSPMSAKYLPSFSDWKGAMVGFSGSYEFVSGNVGFTSSYMVGGLGVTTAPASLSFPFLKDMVRSGSMNLGVTSWIGEPFRVGNLNSPGATERFINGIKYGGN